MSSGGATLLCGDALAVLRTLPDGAARCCVTSPPYFGLRDYGTGTWEGGDPDCDHAVRRDPKIASFTLGGGKATTGHQREGFKGSCPRCGAVRVDNQLGLEPTPDLYVARMVEVFREVRRVLTDDGTLWLNLGDSYAAERSGTRQPAETLAGGIRGKTPDGDNVNRGRRDGENPTRRASPIGLKHKDLIGIPWRVAFALQADGWYLRSDIVWAKPNPMPESVRDRPTKAHEYVFLLSKSERYYYDADAIAEAITTDPRENYPARAKVTGRGTQGAADARGNDRDKSGGFPPRKQDGHGRRHAGFNDRWDTSVAESGVPPTRNARSVWTIATRPYAGAHFATMPAELAERCVLAGSAPGDAVLDPFGGSGTTAAVAVGHGRAAIHIDLTPEYHALARERIGELLCAESAP